MFRINSLKILILTMLFFSCLNKTKDKNFVKLDVWEKILEAVEEKNIEYLLKISEDSLECLECNNGESWIKKEDFFRKNINQMYLAKSKNYSYFVEDISELNNGFDKRIRINYLEEYKGNKYNIIYSILEGKDGIKFLGVFSIP